MNGALFLDRDGVINEEVGYIGSPENFIFQPAVFQLVRSANAHGMPVIVVTNQGGIGKNLYSFADLEGVHQKMLDGFAKEGLTIDAVYFCPHHPESSNCLCRKPESLMFEKAIARFNLEPSLCLMIGDRERDLIPAKNLGITTIIIGEPSPFADYVFAAMQELPSNLIEHFRQKQK